MAPPTFRLIRHASRPGAFNMALDEALAGDGAPPIPTVRLYGWAPWTLSLGWFQRVEERDLRPFEEAGFSVTRRPTGGGAILHGDEITYSVTLPADDPRIPRDTTASYDWLHGALREGLAAVGVAVEPRGPAGAAEGPDPFFCFERTAPIDLVARGRKIAGSAQRRTRTAFLQHGSLPLSPNGSVPGATSVSEERGGSAADPAALEEALVRGFERALGAAANPSTPTPDEEQREQEIAEARYENRAWVLRPWKGPGRAVGPIPPLPPTPPAPVAIFRAAAGPQGLRVIQGAVHPDRALFEPARLRAVDAALGFDAELRVLPAARDPWESTFRRSLFPEEPGAVPTPDEEERRVWDYPRRNRVHLLYGEPPEALAFDALRFNFADLGDRRTGRPWEDAAALVRAVLAPAPRAVVGPGARALLEGREPPFLFWAPALSLRAAAVAAKAPPAKA